MKIPIAMCHGTHEEITGDKPLTREHFDRLVRIARELGFESIDYDELAAWRVGTAELPARPIMFDFDHPVKSMRYDVQDVLSYHGYRGNLFINTKPLNEMYSAPLPAERDRRWMTWEEIGALIELGWHIGSHTVTHPNLSELSKSDPTGAKVREELGQCDATLKDRLGLVSKDFAFTGTSWSSVAEREVMRRYRFGRLWIIGAEYQADGATIRYADLVGVPGPDEPDGGPPMAARYITKESPPYRLPSMELQALIYAPDAFRRYLEGALAP